jgi:FtsZ-binding cell division protein ZapB
MLPVELQHVNHAASTNSQDSTWLIAANPTIALAMSNQHQIDQITERVEQLLLRYEELQRANSLLTHERDSLRSRLNAARSRVDALIERLPEGIRNTVKSPAGNGTES